VAVLSSVFKKFSSYTILAIITMAGFSFGAKQLVYLEAQAVAGFPLSVDDRSIRWYSMDQMDVMQKPSLGFDYLWRLSGAGGDWGMLAVQARLAYDPTAKHDLEPQLYNAYLKVKPGFGDIWIGHNKPAFGLSSYLDNHGTLLQPLSMYGYGYDRDWGAGYYRDFDWGNLGLSATTGSGMPMRFNGNYLLAGRISKGDLNQQNYDLGLSAAYGKNLETMGYHLININPMMVMSAGADAVFLLNRWENRLEFIWSRRNSDFSQDHYVSDQMFFHRLTANLLEENRLKLEVQNRWLLGKWGDGMLTLAGSYQLTSDITFRSMVEIEDARPRVIGQLYWYHKL